jgi:hypothetical protein
VFVLDANIKYVFLLDNKGRKQTMRKLVTLGVLGLIAIALIVGWAPLTTRAADHLDAPLVRTDGRIDITDVYAFQSPQNSANTVLIMNVNPLAGVLSPTAFHPGATYNIKLDTNGDAVEDMTYKIRFSPADSSGNQKVTLRCVPASKCGGSQGSLLASGMTGTNISVQGGGTLRAGLFDDPFFFDLNAFKHGLAFCPGGKGTDFFLGFNVTSIVLEVPSSKLGTHIGVWGTTELNDTQADRMGRPAINTVFIPPAEKDAFNFGQPVNDQANFRSFVVNTLLALGNTSARANALADFLLPDVLTFDTSSSAGFPNGRRLADDVIDIELNLISNGAITTDCVANDSTFSNKFPYLGNPNP